MAKQKFTVDRLVRWHIARLEETKGEFAFTERQTIIDLAADFAIQFGASSQVHDELIALALKHVPISGLFRALDLAPRAGTKTKDHLLQVMIAPLQCHDVDRTIRYAREVLMRELSLEEVRKMSTWFTSCDNESEKQERKNLLDYIREVHPEHLEKFEKHFQDEEHFWNGMGSIL